MKEGLSRSGVLLVGGGESGISKGGRGEIEGKEWPVVGVVMVEDTENVGDQPALKWQQEICTGRRRRTWKEWVAVQIGTQGETLGFKLVGPGVYGRGPYLLRFSLPTFISYPLSFPSTLNSSKHT